MSKHSPNNRLWIILGVLCGFAVLALFGVGAYTGAKAVSSEASVSFPERSQQDSAKNKLTIFVSAENEITFEGKSFKDVATLKEDLKRLDEEVLDSTVFVLSISKNSKHQILVLMMDMFDDLALKSMILIGRQNAE